MYEISYGKKYEKGLDVADIAKRYRADVKAAQKAGELPAGLKLSVTISRYSMGRSITVTVKECPFLITLPERVKHEQENPHRMFEGGFFTSEAKTLLDCLRSMLNAYNFDGSEMQVDYYHVNFHGDVRVDWNLEKAEKEMLRLGFTSAAELESAVKKMEADNASKKSVLQALTAQKEVA